VKILFIIVYANKFLCRTLNIVLSAHILYHLILFLIIVTVITFALEKQVMHYR